MGERRRRDDTERDDNLMNRRVFLARGAFGVGFVALSGKLWRMQIDRGAAYQGVAEENITRFEYLKAPRGRIVDRNNLPLAESRRSWTVSIVGSRLPENAESRQAVLNQLAETLELKYVLALDRTLVPTGSEAAVVNEVARRLPDQFDAETLLTRIQRTDATVEQLKAELSKDAADRLLASLNDIPGVRVLNEIDFALAKQVALDAPMVVKKDVDPAKALTIAANIIYLPGVTVDDKTLMRQYPGGPAFAHMLGYVGPITGDEFAAANTDASNPVYENDDVVGRGGIEQALEADLRGKKGGRWIQVDSQGVERFELIDRRREPQAGLSAQLTIDKEFQLVVTQALQDGITFASSDALSKGREAVGSGVAIAIDPRNGEILAIASLPNFDNQLFVNGISDAQYKAYIDNPYKPLLDRSISGVFPPGSTLKPLLAAAALQEKIFGEDTANTKITCKGEIRVPWNWDESQGNTYPCWLREGHGQVDIFRGLSESCDIYFYNVGAPKDKPEDVQNAAATRFYNLGDTNPSYFSGLGIERIERYLREAFGFGAPTGIELAGEAEGLVPNPKWLFQSPLAEYWSIGDTINVSIGQGHLLCTPLQLTVGTARIANRGTLWQPRLVKALINADGTTAREITAKELVPERMSGSDKLASVEQQYIDMVREGMRRTSIDGTAKGRITFTDPAIGSKSGTAEFGIAENGKYKKGHAWFSAFAPYDDPRICLVVLVEGGNEGSAYAGPIANTILDKYFHQLGR